MIVSATSKETILPLPAIPAMWGCVSARLVISVIKLVNHAQEQ